MSSSVQPTEGIVRPVQAAADGSRSDGTLRVAGRLQLAGSEWHEAELRGLSADDVVVSCPALRRQSGGSARIGMRARLRLHEREPPMTVQGVVTSVESETIVLSLANEEPSRREALRERVLTESHTVPRVAGRRGSAALLSVCRDALSGFLARRFKHVFEGARETLFESARDANSDRIQTECFDAMQEVERLRQTIETGILQFATQDVDALLKPSRQPPRNPAVDHEPLTLVDTNSLNDWLTVVAIVSRTRLALGDSEKRLCMQLGTLLGRDLGADQNPFGVQRLAGAFHDALQNLAAEKRTRRALFGAFETCVISELHELHAELHATLAAAGFAASDQPPRIVRNREERRPPPGASRSVAADVDGLEAAPAGARSNAPGRPSADDRSATTAREGATREVIGVPEQGRSGQLLQLCGRWLSSVAGEVGAAATQPVPSAREPLDGGQLDQHLVALQQAPQAGDDESARPLVERVRESLGEDAPRLAAEPANAVTTGANFIDTLLADPLLDPAAKHCLQRLELPLLRALVADSSWLTRPAHPLRRLIDDIGLAVSSIPGEDGMEATEVLDQIAERMLAAPEPGESTVAALLPALSALVAVQQRVIAERIETLVQRRAEPASAVREWRRRLHPLDDTTVENARPMPAEWRAWLDQARHMKVGDALIADARGAYPRPVRVVWMDRGAQTLLLADACGEHADMQTRQELAMGLRRGVLRQQPVVSTSLVERALLGMLGQTYGHALRATLKDPQTGVASRRPLEWQLHRALARCQPGHASEYLLVTQIDRFDALGRRCGSEAAGRLLTSFADILRRQFGDGSEVARLYGSRFAVLTAAASRADMLARAERLRRTVEQARCVYRGEDLELALSLAVLPLDTRLDGPDQALRLAEDVLARAAAAGGNRVRIEEFSTPVPVCREDESFASLLEAGHIALRCQRVQPLAPDSQRLPYYEVLLGVHDTDGRLRPPGRLIAAAERSGEIATLDRWVVRNSIDWLAAHRRRLGHIAGLAINLSGVTLSDETLLAFILQHIEASGLAPGRLMFEVTESAAIADMQVAQLVMRGLRDAGCKLALDDFGTGSASFAYLKQLPVDTVKIDGLFVRELLDNESDRAMVQSINEIAHCLGRATVAEFAESAAIVEELRRLGVDYAQGYAVARPEPLATLLQDTGASEP